MNIKAISPKRLVVYLESKDDRLLTGLRAVLERREAKRLSLSEVVRILLRTQSDREGISNEIFDK